MSVTLTKENIMKRIAIALLAAAGLAATTARADHDSRVTVRGSITIGAPVAPVYVAPAPVYVPAPRYAPPPPARGYWKEVTVKTWVPERWVVVHNRWGRPERVCEPGHFVYRTDRVWVDGRNDRGHDHRDYSYGYGHGRR